MNRRMFWSRELRVGGGVASSLVDGGGLRGSVRVRRLELYRLEDATKAAGRIEQPLMEGGGLVTPTNLSPPPVDGNLIIPQGSDVCIKAGVC
jgi:hypothetical protein